MVHDTAMSQYTPCTLFHRGAVGTWTTVAGKIAGTVALHAAAANETLVVTIPVIVPSNSVALKGAYLKSIEIDYELIWDNVTSITAVVNKVTRGADGAVAVVAPLAFTQTPTAGEAKMGGDYEHRLVLTLTTPFWVLNTEYVLVELTIVTGAGAPLTGMLGAFANFTLRV